MGHSLAVARPSLILYDDSLEAVVFSAVHAMHALAKNSKLITLSAAGHLASLEKADDWNRAVIDYFK